MSTRRYRVTVLTRFYSTCNVVRIAPCTSDFDTVIDFISEAALIEIK